MKISIQDLSTKFNNINIPKHTIHLNKAESIPNPQLTINTHLKYLTSNHGNKTFIPYYNRLIKILKAIS